MMTRPDLLKIGISTFLLESSAGVGLALIHWMPQLGSMGPWIGASLYIIALGIALSITASR